MDAKFKYLFWVLIFITGFFITGYSQQENTRLENLSKQADVILIGKVTKQTSDWNENKTRIFTKATLQVDEYLKGNGSKNSIEVTYPGGEVGEVGELYTHMPRFSYNEEVLVFLKKDAKSSGYKVCNGEDGKIRVVRDENTGEKITTSHLKLDHLKSQIKDFLNEK